MLSALGTDTQAFEAVRREYPHLTPDNVQQAIRYAWALVHALVPEMSEKENDRLAESAGVFVTIADSSGTLRKRPLPERR